MLEAKEWVEAIRNAESNLEQAQDAVDASQDPIDPTKQASDAQLKGLQQAGERYEEVTTAHKERLAAIRSWWRGEPWVDPEEEKRRREEEEFRRYIESL